MQFLVTFYERFFSNVGSRAHTYFFWSQRKLGTSDLLKHVWNKGKLQACDFSKYLYVHTILCKMIACFVFYQFSAFLKINFNGISRTSFVIGSGQKFGYCTQSTFSCSKATIETLEQGFKYVQI